MGLNAGPVDGVWGSKKGSALTKFYAVQSLKFDWILDQNELTDLREALASNSSFDNRHHSDQPDQNKDYKIHFNYVVFEDGEDRKQDLNGVNKNGA